MCIVPTTTELLESFGWDISLAREGTGHVWTARLDGELIGTGWINVADETAARAIVDQHCVSIQVARLDPPCAICDREHRPHADRCATDEQAYAHHEDDGREWRDACEVTS